MILLNKRMLPTTIFYFFHAQQVASSQPGLLTMGVRRPPYGLDSAGSSQVDFGDLRPLRSGLALSSVYQHDVEVPSPRASLDVFPKSTGVRRVLLIRNPLVDKTAAQFGNIKSVWFR